MSLKTLFNIHFKKVWIGFFVSSAIFILVTAAYIKLQEKMEQVEPFTQPFIETMFNQLEYVLTIIANQGMLKQ